MKELDLNRQIVQSIKISKGWAFKLPDPSFADIKRGAGKLPYDIYGETHDGRGLHMESKLIKPQTNSLLSSFAFKEIREHQVENLTELSEIRSRNKTNQLLAYSIGYWRPRSLYVVFFFDVDYIHDLMAKGVTSLKGPEMMKFYEEGRFLPVKKKTLDARRIEDVLIK